MLPWVVALLYACALFAFAAWADRSGGRPLLRRLRPLAYALAISVYCTSWTYYGAVGSAVSEGWPYLPIYLGPIIVFLFGHRFLRRLVDAFQADGANSLSDFIGGRFGSSAGVARLVTLLALLGSIPYIALQLRSLSATFDIIGGGPAQTSTSVLIAVGLTLFALIYGTRRYDPASRNDAVLFAVAVESVLKLVALLIAGAFAAALLMRLPAADVEGAVREFGSNFAPSLINADFFVITLLSMAAIFCLPRQFYITVIEAGSGDDVNAARWPFLAYMVLTLLVVLPISVAGLSLLSPGTAPDLYVLSLPLTQGWDMVALIVFLGGFSAATAMVIVETIALSTMVSNDLIAPALLRRRRLAASDDLSGPLLNARRATIIGIMAASLGWALAIPVNQQLASIGLVAFAAMAQFAPVLILAVYGANRDAAAAKAGLSAGLLVWTYTLALPQVLPASVLAALAGTLADPGALLGIDGLSQISHGTLWSVGANLAAYVLVTMRRVQTAAIPALLRDTVPAASPVEDVAALQAVVARFVGNEVAAQHFGMLDPAQRISRASTRKAERLIAGVVGLPSARAFLGSALHGSNLSHAEVARLLDDTGQSLRFSKGLLAATLEHIDPGVSVVDRDLNIVAWNSRYLEMFDFPNGMVHVGAPVADLIRYNAERGECGPGEVDAHVEKRLSHMRRGNPHSFERVRPDGRVLKTVGGPMPSGGYVMCFTDVTTEAAALREVERARAELEMRVIQRTQELQAANQALAKADSEKTRFLAAASHDLLQPLHAARLFAAALRRDMSDGQAPLVGKLDRSIDAAELLLRTLLDISKLDSGGVVPKFTPLDLRPFLTELVETMAPLAREKDISLTMARGRDVVVQTDPVLLRSIVQNFLSNAVRYTARGGVLIGVRRRGQGVRIDVFDTGPGIAPEEQAIIFREFERLPNGTESGVGLGLAIVERTARLLDVPISLRSRTGHGSRFSVTLPVSASPAAPAAERAAAHVQPVAGMRILVVDDEAANGDALRAYLESAGHRVTIRLSASAALAESGPFDAALVDFNLGGGTDGLSLIDGLLTDRRVGRAALVTAEQPEAYRQRADAMGVAVFTKPIALAALDLWLGQAAGGQSALKPAAA